MNLQRGIDYNFDIQFCGRSFKITVKGTCLQIEGFGPEIVDNPNLYKTLRKYLENEGFIIEVDYQKGIYDLF
jgi:hypothetical protein